MSDEILHSDKQENTARRRWPKLLKHRIGRGSLPDQHRAASHSRSTSRLSHGGKLLDREKEKAESVQFTTGAHTSAAAEAELDDNRDAYPIARSAQPGAKTAAAGLNRDDDMWAIAEEELRKDPRKCEILDKYDRILEDYFGSKLKPVGTLERREQFLDFLSSEIEKLNKTDSETQLKKCNNKARRFFKSAVGCIIASKDIIIAAATPCLPASVACAGVMVLLSFCVQAADQRHLFFDGLNTISGSICRLTEYEAFLSRNENRQVEEVKTSITAACRNIIEFQARAACFLRLNPIESAIRNTFKVDGWDELLSAIKKAETDVKACAKRKSLNDVCDIFDKIDQLEKKIIDKLGECSMKQAETQEAIDRRQRVNAFLELLYNNACFYERSKNRNRERVPGTCNWFTGHDLFKKWNLPAGSLHQMSNLLYVTADPGCGKSVLSRYLIDQILPDNGKTVCYFFFKDDFEEQKSSLSAVCTLLHQFFELNPSLLTDTILAKHEARGENFVKSFPELWNVFVHAIGGQETVCVFDALDECQESDRKQLIDAITGTEVSGLKFLLTSRPYEHIRREVFRRFDEAQEASIHLQGDRGPTPDAIVQEIKLVMDSRITKTANDFQLEPDERQLMRKQLESVPNRTYLWITLVFDGLMEKKSGITKKDIMNLTKRLPQGANDAYENILRKGHDKEKSKRLLHLILGAKRPLSLSEMSVALAFNGQQFSEEDIISEEKVQVTIRNLCGLFVTIVDKRVYLLHQTAREFLVRDFSDEKKAGNGRPSGLRDCNTVSIISVTQGLTLLLALLFSIMRPIFHRIWLLLSDSWQHSIDLTDSNSVLAETCISCLQPDFAMKNASMFEYSAIYWADHYCQSGRSSQAALAKMTQDLCLLESRKQWAEIHYKHNTIPITGSPLCLASSLGLKRAVKMFLLEQGSIGVDLQNEVDSKDSIFGQTPLLWAAGYGYEAVVKLLLATGKVDIESKSWIYGQTPLSLAAGNGHEAVVKLLLATGKVDIESKDSEYGQTPLSWAARNGHKAVVKLLLVTGKVDIESKDSKYGQTPLSWAAEYGYEAVVKLLLAVGKADINSKDSFNRIPLLWAAMRGHEAVVRLLLATGKVDIESKDNDGQTPLSWAAREGHEAVVKLLVATGKVDIESKDNDGQTPLSWAAREGHEAVVKLLVATGKVDIESKDNDGQTPLSLASMNGHEVVVKLLLATGKVDIESKDKFGKTPLSWAAENGYEAVVKLLLATGKVDIDSKNNYGQTPLSWAAEYGYEAVVKLLLAVGKADINSKDSFNRIPLLWAAMRGHEAVVRLLLATGKVDIESKDKYGQTPLSWAARKGHEAVVKLLLATGKVDIESKDDYGQTPLSLAAKNGNKAVVKLLQSSSS